MIAREVRQECKGGHSDPCHCAALARSNVITAAGFMYIYYGLPTAPFH